MPLAPVDFVDDFFFCSFSTLCCAAVPPLLLQGALLCSRRRGATGRFHSTRSAAFFLNFLL